MNENKNVDQFNDSALSSGKTESSGDPVEPAAIPPLEPIPAIEASETTDLASAATN